MQHSNLILEKAAVQMPAGLLNAQNAHAYVHNSKLHVGTTFGFRTKWFQPVLVQRLCRAHEELLWGLERDARVQGKLQVSRRKILEKSKQQHMSRQAKTGAAGCLVCHRKNEPTPSPEPTSVLYILCPNHLVETDGSLLWSVSG